MFSVRSDSFHRQNVHNLAGLSCERDPYACIFLPAHRNWTVLKCPTLVESEVLPCKPQTLNTNPQHPESIQVNVTHTPQESPTTRYPPARGGGGGGSEFPKFCYLQGIPYNKIQFHVQMLQLATQKRCIFNENN
jgi:hypothetical protein